MVVMKSIFFVLIATLSMISVASAKPLPSPSVSKQTVGVFGFVDVGIDALGNPECILSSEADTISAEDNSSPRIPLSSVSGTFKNLFVTNPGALPNGSMSYTWRVNGTDTGITCTITAPGTSCSDTVHSAAITVGQSYVLVPRCFGPITTGRAVDAGIELDIP
jgi:hypothetical protein